MGEPTPEFAQALEDAGLLQDEYPDVMAQRSCTCEGDAICGAHRLFQRYSDLFGAFQESHRAKRQMRAERDALTQERDALREQNELLWEYVRASDVVESYAAQYGVDRSEFRVEIGRIDAARAALGDTP